MINNFFEYVDKSILLESKGDSSKTILQDILSFLRVLYLHYHTSHWQSKEYQLHLLFQRFYETIPEEIDNLAEKMVGYYGNNSVELSIIEIKTQKWIKMFEKTKDLIKRSLDYENKLQELIKHSYDSIKKNKEMSLGLDDYLMSLSNDHETNIYLLKQYN